MKQSVRLYILGLTLTLAGCANFSAGNLFGHYSLQTQLTHENLQSGDYQQALEQLPSGVAGDVLDNMERGRVAFLAEDYPQSFSALQESDFAVRELEQQATISISETANSVGALAINDNLKTYQPADYELGFLHLYLALNYLKQNDLDAALVEMRRANQVQEFAKKQREEQLAQAEQDLESQGGSLNVGSILAQYPDAGHTLQSVQNGYLFFLSGLLFETDGDLNSAYVDYRRALAVMPDNPQVIQQTMAAAKKLGMNQDLAILSKQYGNQGKPLKAGQGKLIVLEETGVVTALQEWRLDLPYFTLDGYGTYLSLALPYYPQNNSSVVGDVRVAGKALGRHELMDVDQMAAYHLKEKLPSIIIRQALRLYAKEALQHAASEEQAVGGALLEIWSVLTERADTRSWQTLPARVNTAGKTLSAGEHQLTVGDTVYPITIRNGETTLVWVSRQGSNASIWHKQLGRL